MMRAAVRCEAPMPSPSMMMFFALRPVVVMPATSKLPVRSTICESLCVARIFSV